MEQKIINESTIVSVLDWCFEKVVNGMPGFESAKELAESYINDKGTTVEKVDNLIKWQDLKCATAGFVTNIGGLITMPIAIPAELISVVYIQMRMIAAIAYIGGYDLRNDKVRTLIFVCLVGNSANEVLKTFSLKLGMKLTEQAIKKIPTEIIIAINKAVGFKLITKFGEKGLINLDKVAPPLVSGFIGAAFDCFASHVIGKIAKAIFIEKYDNYFELRDEVINLTKK